MTKLYIVVAIALVLLGCGSSQKLAAKNECGSYSTERKRLNCYIIDFRNTIRLQLEQDIRTWFEYNGPFGGWYFGDVLLKVDLKPNGEIERLEVIESSNNLRFEDFIMQSIRNASPFNMPEDEITRRKLKSFTWGLEI